MRLSGLSLQKSILNLTWTYKVHPRGQWEADGMNPTKPISLFSSLDVAWEDSDPDHLDRRPEVESGHFRFRFGDPDDAAAAEGGRRRRREPGIGPLQEFQDFVKHFCFRYIEKIIWLTSYEHFLINFWWFWSVLFSYIFKSEWMMLTIVSVSIFCGCSGIPLCANHSMETFLQTSVIFLKVSKRESLARFEPVMIRLKADYFMLSHTTRAI